MNSCSALLTAAFWVRSPLTSGARSIRSGSTEGLVAIYEPSHMTIHRLLLAQGWRDPTLSVGHDCRPIQPIRSVGRGGGGSARSNAADGPRSAGRPPLKLK